MRLALNAGRLLRYRGFYLCYKPDAPGIKKLSPYRGFQLVTKTPRTCPELEAESIFGLKDKVDQFHLNW